MKLFRRNTGKKGDIIRLRIRGAEMVDCRAAVFRGFTELCGQEHAVFARSNHSEESGSWRGGKLDGFTEDHIRVVSSERAGIGHWPLYGGHAHRDDVSDAFYHRVVTERGWTWLEAFAQPVVWVLFAGRMFSDPVWFFYQNWYPKYLVTVRGLTQAEVKITWVMFMAAGFGSLVGGWLAGRLVKRGMVPERARLLVMLGCAVLMPFLVRVILKRKTTDVLRRNKPEGEKK